MGAGTAADRFDPKRGVNTEIWVEWLGVEEMLARPGFLDIYPDYPRHMPPETLEKIAGQGVDFIRIAADPAPLLATAGSPRQAALIGQVQARVREAQAAGLKVILDLHSFPRGQEDFGVEWALGSEAHFAAYAEMVGRVAAALAAFPADRTAFQPMNEPVQDCDALSTDPAAATWPARLKRLHDVARAGAPDLPLVLSGACWGGAWALSFLDPAAIGDDNVLWSFHSYDPFTYSHQGADWTGSILRFFAGIPYPPSSLTDDAAVALVEAAAARARASGLPLASEASPAALSEMLQIYRDEGDGIVRQEMDRAAAWADAHGVPRNRLIHDEFGAVWVDAEGREFDAAGHLHYLSDKIAVAAELGFGWALWDWRGSMRFGQADYRLDARVCAVAGWAPC